MDIEPKHKLIGATAAAVFAVGLGLILIGRVTAAVDATSVLLAVVAAFAVVGSMLFALVRHLPVSRRFDGILLSHKQTSADGYVSAIPRRELIGRTGVALSDMRPVGTAEFDGARVDVETEGEYVIAGTPVTVVRAEGMRVVVRRAPPAALPPRQP